MPQSAERNLLVLFKGGHRYLFVYDDESVPEIRQHIVDLAVDPDEVLDLLDAERLLDRIDQGG